MERETAKCKPAIKRTGQQRQGGNASDEESPPAKRQQKMRSLPKRARVAYDGGQQFEIKMTAVIGLRGMARGDDFRLLTNKADSGNFDDFVYKTGTRGYFLVLRHTDNPDICKLMQSDLVPLLHQCFESYCSIIQDPIFKDFESSEFIIYTNKQLGRKLLKHNRQQREIDEIFKTCDTREIFNFIPDKNKKSDVYTLVENKVKKSGGFGNLIPQQQEFKLKKVSEFLQKLIMVTSQKHQKEIDSVIIEVIRQFDAVTVDPKEYQTELLHFKTQMGAWWNNMDKAMTPDMVGKWLQKAKTKTCALVVESLSESCKPKSFGTGIKFSDREISRFQTELPNKPAVHLRSDALTLCSILLLQCQKESKRIFVTFELLKSNKNMLLHAWLGGQWEWLIVFCDSTVQQSDISETCITISESIKHAYSTKRAIILTACSVQQNNNFVPIEHEFNFEQLSKESQETVLNKKIDFQGREVTMRSVLQRHGNVEHVLGPGVVTDLMIEGTAVNIGGRLQENEGYYANRELERNIWLQSNVLQKSNDVFAVSGTTKEDLLKIIMSEKAVERIWVEDVNHRDFTQDMTGRIFFLSDENAKTSFLAMGEKIKGTSLHWVEFKNGDLLWNMSTGGTETLLDYIDADKTRADKSTITEWMKSGSCEVNEDSIWKLGERTVLVVAEPGMGKSSTTTQVAWHTKLADLTSWVVRINWNDHTRKLQEIDEAKFNFDSLVEFLCSAAFPESKYTDINRCLLKQALQNSGNVAVLMDGFDEICPNHANKAAVIFNELMETKVSKVWVTSRPVEKEKLEEKLRVTAFSLKGLSRNSQIDMLCELWMLSNGTKKRELDFFLRRVNNSVNDVDFTGRPLYITMIATIYEKDVEKNLNSGDLLWQEIDLVNMYEVFVETKLRIYLTEKLKVDAKNSIDPEFFDLLKESLFNKFEKCALVAILPPTMLKSLHDKKIEEKIKPFLAKVQAGNYKTGIVTNVVDGKPQFVDRTFAEYFTARWLSRNFKDNRSVLENIFLDRTNELMLYMFTRMLCGVRR